MTQTWRGVAELARGGNRDVTVERARSDTSGGGSGGGGWRRAGASRVALTRLTLFEVGRLARSPLPPAGLLWGGYLAAWPVWDGVAGIDWDEFGEMVLPWIGYPAGGVFVAAAIIAARNTRFGQKPVAPVPPWARTVALALAVLTWGTLVGALFYGCLYALVTHGVPHGIVGYTSVAQIVAVALLPALAGVAGAALGAWLRSWIPAVIVVAAIPLADLLALDLTVPAFNEDLIWPQPNLVVLGGLVLGTVPLDTSGLLVTTVAAAILMCGCLLLLRDGHEIQRLWRAATGALAAAALVVGAVSYALQGAAYELMDAGLPLVPSWEDPPYHCEEHDGVTYCAYEAYTPWIASWSENLEPVVAALPDEAHDQMPVLRQDHFHQDHFRQGYYSASGEMAPEDLFGWPNDRSYMRAEFTTLTVGGDLPWELFPCSLAGQGRAVVPAWLVDHHRPPEVDRDELLWDTVDITHALQPPPRSDVAAMYAVLDAPPDAVLAGLEEHWDTLVRPETTPDRAAELLGATLTDGHRELADRFVWEYYDGVDYVELFGVEPMADPDDSEAEEDRPPGKRRSSEWSWDEVPAPPCL